MTQQTFLHARELGFSSINIDLIYGLPFQTISTFEETISHIIDLRPDRIALFSYAQVPDIKPHQKAIREETLPTTEEKFRIYTCARSKLTCSGYVAIGMDHFALHTDELAIGYANKTLSRNFQGYTILKTDTLLGLGMTSIGSFQHAYVQNKKTLADYYAAIDQGMLPAHLGCALSQDDLIRRHVIQTLMCRFELDKRSFEETFQISFDRYFEDAASAFLPLIEDGLVQDTKDHFLVTRTGELFVRNIASIFDAYYATSSKHHSKGI
jgi:oxygen-independent coproporphyrinogen-3 oxidase